MRPNQEFKNLLNNTNFSLALKQGSVINYDASVESDWTQDYASTVYDQILYPGYATVTYTNTQNGLNYMSATVPGSPASNLQFATPIGSTPEVSDSYTVIVVAKGGSGYDWYHQTPRTGGVYGTGLGLLKVHIDQNTLRYAISDNPSFLNTAFIGETYQSYNPNSTIYSTSGWYISVTKVVYNGSTSPGNPSMDIYMTTNGRGSSGGAYYVSGSFNYITGGYPTGAVSSGQLFTTSLSPGQSSYRGETLYWNKALTQYQIDFIEGYLKTKWGVTY